MQMMVLRSRCLVVASLAFFSLSCMSFADYATEAVEHNTAQAFEDLHVRLTKPARSAVWLSKPGRKRKLASGF